MTKAFSESLHTLQQRNEAAVTAYLHASHPQATQTLWQAMRYSALGGKRLRACLVYLTGQSLGIDLATLDAPAASVELMHAFSLIHDDLPAMDDDELRRGQPTCHLAFDEATAILAGDALQTLSFEALGTAPHLTDTQKVQMVTALAKASGAAGMAGGQFIDIQAVDHSLSLAQLQEMHALKTGHLITASVQLGYLSGHTQAHTAFDTFSQQLGIAFQIQDDILDCTQSSDTLGKPAGSDIKGNKPTYPAMLGLAQASTLAQETFAAARDTLHSIPHDTGPLQALVDLIENRCA